MISKTIVVTGAGGYFAKNVLAKLADISGCQMFAFSSNPDNLSLQASNIQAIDNSDLERVLAENKIDDVIHFAFSRRFNPVADIAASVDFAARVYSAAVKGCVNRVVNISSQSVYAASPDFKSEDAKIAPDSFYSMAKYASEVLLRNICCEMKWVNLRFDSIAQSQRLLPSFIKQAKENHQIKLVGGRQQFSFIDIEDAANAVVAFIYAQNAKRRAYNVGINKNRYGLVELANFVKNRIEHAGYNPVTISLEENDTSLFAGLNTTAFMEDTGWFPRVDIEKTIDKMIK